MRSTLDIQSLARAARRLTRGLAFVVAFIVLCRLAHAAGPAYLADMPTAAQVEATIKGSDATDTAVRQAEALGQLCSVVRSLSQGGELGNKMTAEETALCASYQQAAAAISKRATGLPSYGPQSWAMRTQRYHDERFRKEVLSDFPKVQAAYEARKRADGAASDARESSPDVPPLFALLGLGAVALVLGASGIALMRGAANGPKVRGGVNENIVVRTIAGPATGAIPQDPGVVVEHLCIGAEERFYTSTAPVTTSATGHVSGGGTVGGSYTVLDFGWAVHNRTAASVRFQVTLEEIDKDGYVVKKHHVWRDIAPGERRRAWAGLVARTGLDFHRQILKEVAFGPTPADPGGLTTFTVKTSPNVSLFVAFGLDAAPLDTSKGAGASRGRVRIPKAALTLILLSILLGGVALLGLLARSRA